MDGLMRGRGGDGRVAGSRHCLLVESWARRGRWMGGKRGAAASGGDATSRMRITRFELV